MRGWRPWTVQPPPGTPIDWDCPLAAELVDVIDMRGFPRSVLLNTPATFFGTSQQFGQPTAQGQAFDTLASYAGVSFARSDSAYANLNESIVFVGALSGFTGQYAGIFASVDQGGTSNRLTFQYSGTPGAYLLAIGNNVLGISVPIILGVPYVITATITSTGNAALYLNGVLEGTVSSSPPTLTGSKFVIFGERTSSVSYATKGTSPLALIYGRTLNATDAWEISKNPWQIFHRRRRAYSLITSSTISASISDAVTSSDAYTLSATAATAISAAATSSDAYALAATVPSAISEAISPSDVYALAVTVAAALDSSAAASSALTAVVTIAATIAEVSTAQDTLGVTATILAAIAEAATATDTQATGSVTSAAYAESATAAAIFSATVSIAATLTEAGLAADQIAAMATVAADLAESGAASDAYLRSVLLAVELLENAAAADELSATAFEQIIDAAKTIITILQARDTLRILQ